MRAKTLILLCVLCLTNIFPSSVLADDKAAASAFADELGKKALAVISDKSKGKDEKTAQLEELFVQNVDIDWIGKFVVGRYWKAANDAQKQQYMDNYKKFIIAHYTSNLTEFTNTNFEVTKVLADENGGNVVTMHIKRPQAEDMVVDYTIRKNDSGSLKVYDITVEGVSMITTQRSDFSSVIAQNGFDYLISQLAVRSQKEKETPKS